MKKYLIGTGNKGISNGTNKKQIKKYSSINLPESDELRPLNINNPLNGLEWVLSDSLVAPLIAIFKFFMQF